MSQLSRPQPEAGERVPEQSAPAPDRWWLPPALLVAGFLLLLWQVTSRGPVTQLDVHVRNVIQGVATSGDLSGLVRAGHGLADLGDPPLCVPILLVATVAAAIVGRTWRPPLVFLGAVGVLILTAVLKISINRPGPGQYTAGRTNPFNAGPGNLSFGPGLADAGEGWGYFPSGHTADALICFGTAAILLTTWVFTGARQRCWAKWIVAFLVAAVIVGLLWSNYHWLSDVVGSLCLCGAALLVFHRFCVRGRRGSPGAVAVTAAPDPAPETR